jgi:hypothetical protein
MDMLYSWRARRAGAGITITHSCGRVVNVESIQVTDGRVIATKQTGDVFELHVPDQEREKYGVTGAAMLRTDKPLPA